MSHHDGHEHALHFHPIGIIRTPYKDRAPNQPPDREVAPGAFRLELDEAYVEALDQLETFDYVHVIFAFNRAAPGFSARVSPPWAKGREVGLFASRSPQRPNPIGLSIVRLLGREGGVVHTGPLDILDGTPLLDLKPYLRDLDARSDANRGWVEDFEDADHVMEHLTARPHDHGAHDHGHEHGHEHGHSHDHDPDD